MQVLAVDGFLARCTAKGVERDANLLLLQHETIAAGDYLVVHLGYATEKVSAEQARLAWELYDEMLARLGPG